jgi:hypothetical protein
VNIADLDPDVLRLLTQRKVVDYLRTRRSAALGRELLGHRNIASRETTSRKRKRDVNRTRDRPSLW